MSKKTKPGNEIDITITEKAAKKILEIAKQEKKEKYGLKLYVMEGGCSGFQYGMDFEKKLSKTDILIEQHGLKLFLDKESIKFLLGSKIDFIDTAEGQGFKIDNPNVKSDCSCDCNSC
jgi:iron-sulfur cluster assembly accessory protein